MPTLFWLMVENDEIAVLEVEAVQLVASTLRIHDILVDHESGALCVGGDALADLAGRNTWSADGLSGGRVR